MVSMVSIVSIMASKHLCSFLAHCPYHARSVSTVAYHHNTHCPHHFRAQECVLLTSFLVFSWGGGADTTAALRSSGPILWSLQSSKDDADLNLFSPKAFVIITTTYNNILSLGRYKFSFLIMFFKRLHFTEYLLTVSTCPFQSSSLPWLAS